MIELTVKTLDSKNHAFSVPDDITVKELKEQIADSVNISADSQRLIYCGRVLQDEKLLSEYDVNGKVIHLVQRAPPVSNGSGPDRGASSTRSGANANVRRSPFRLFAPGNANVPGNAMYLGAVAFPGEIMDASGISMQQPRQCLSQSRLNVVRNMLRRASVILSRLESNDSVDTSPDSGSGSSDTNAEEGSVSSSVPVTTVDPTPAAFVVDDQQVPDVNNTAGESSEPIVEVVIESSSEVQNSDSATSVLSSDAESQPSQPTREQQPTPNDGEGDGGNTPSRYPRTQALADLLDQAAEINTRVQPFLTQYHQLMREDPSFNDQVAVSTNQRLFTTVSEIMHNLAHAYHALSDIMCDFSQPPPRFLRCRPVLIHHSAVVQTGIPIQVATSFTTSSSTSNQQSATSASARPNGNAASASAPSTTSTSPAPTDEVSPPQVPVTESEQVTVTSTVAEPATPSTTSTTPTTGQQQPSSRGGVRVGQVVGSGSGFEIFVDVAPGSLTIDSVEAAVVNPANSSDGNTWQNPPEFVQNLISALAGQFMGATVQQFRFPDQQNASSSTSTTSTGTNTNTSSTTSPAASSQQNGNGQPAAASSTQNSQARGNTATHPTTATQTRSTARPHVHLSPGSIHGLSRNNFDPFLPCNSHHIRGNRGGRQRSNSFHATNTSAPNNASEIPSARVAPSRVDVQGSGSISISLRADPIPNGEQHPTTATATLSQPTRLPPGILQLIQSLGGGASPPSEQTGTPYVTTIGGLLQALQTNQPFQVPLNNPSAANQSSATAGQNSATTDQNRTTAGQNPTTLAQILESVPGYSYTPGESIMTDTFMILAQCLSFMDMIELGMGSSDCLLRARPQLRQLISQRLLNNQPFTISAITQIIDRFNAELRPHFSVFENARMREEVDLPASISLYNHSMLPSILNTVMKEDQSTFHRTLIRKCTQYVRQLCALLQYCCLDGVTGLETVLRALVAQMNSNVPGVLQDWTMTHSIINFRTFVSTLNVPVDEIKRFLVYRMGNPAATSPQPATTPPPIPPAAEPMDVQEVDTIEINLIREPPVADTPPTQHLNEALGWQSALPSEWVPIITRDSQRQRRQSSQGPFSDAYLSGMPSKRRKLVTSAKPQGNLSQVITDSMTTALGAAGMSSGPEVDVIAQRAGQDDTLRTAYREQVRTTLGHSLNSNPDYLPEKYPNTAKYFKKH